MDCPTSLDKSTNISGIKYHYWLENPFEKVYAGDGICWRNRTAAIRCSTAVREHNFEPPGEEGNVLVAAFVPRNLLRHGFLGGRNESL